MDEERNAGCGPVDGWRELSGLGWPRAYPLVQFPNAPLWGAIAATALGWIVAGEARDYAEAAGTVAIGVWAWLELFQGVNAFRRVLGLVVLVNTLVGLAERIG